jgi:hypothetical protein
MIELAEVLIEKIAPQSGFVGRKIIDGRIKAGLDRRYENEGLDRSIFVHL